MNKHTLFCSIIVSVFCVQPVSAMLTLMRRLTLRETNQRMLTQKRDLATRVSKKKVFQEIDQPLDSIRLSILPQEQVVTIPQLATPLLADYPYFEYLEKDSLIRKKCEHNIEKIHVINMCKKNLADLQKNKQELEHEFYMKKTHDINGDELCKITLITNKMQRISQYIETNRVNNTGFDDLHEYLRKVYDKGTFISSSPREFLAHMINHPRDISLSNCFANYPLSTVLLTQSAFIGFLLAAAINHPGLICLLASGSVIPFGIGLSASNSTKEIISEILNNEPDTIKQSEFEKYNNVARILGIEGKKSNKTAKTLGQRIDDFIKKINKFS